MTIFLRLLNSSDKAADLESAASAYRSNRLDERIYQFSSNSFQEFPGSPFVYWASDSELTVFREIPDFECEDRCVKQGLATADDFRFVRAWWEIDRTKEKWLLFAKGGSFSPFFTNLYVCVNWENDGRELRNFFNPKTGKLYSRPQNTEYFFQAGLTWPARPHIRGAFSHVPPGCIFSHTGTMVFLPGDQHWAYLAILNSDAYIRLLHLLMPRGGEDTGQTLKYELGYVKSVPLPSSAEAKNTELARWARLSWSIKQKIQSTDEISQVFILPDFLRSRLGDYSPDELNDEFATVQAEINGIAYDLYGFSDADRAAALGSSGTADEDGSNAAEDTDDSEDDDGAEAIDQTDGLLSWAAGVAFGRFDWRLATGEREAPPEPEPFDSLPAKSPGMLPDGVQPFHAHSGILVDDRGHPHDLPRLIEEVLACVHADVPGDVRRWLQRDFFPLHLKQYSKSRRKAPIYWPLSTASGSYTLWLYYPSLSSQTLYTAVNDFVEPKLKQVGRDAATLRDKSSARSRDDEKAYEVLQTLELELIELRDTLLQIAPTYRPNHDDGVQITAAPLWQLFRHKPWQKILKDTWAKLEKGDYDWAHLAMNYWPDRVREKCKTDKSLAIAHGLEHLYVEPETQPKNSRGRKKAGGDE